MPGFDPFDNSLRVTSLFDSFMRALLTRLNNDQSRPVAHRQCSNWDSVDRTGLGLGLAFSRWGAEANNGRIYTRNLPGRGCIFTLDLPRFVAAA